MTSATRLRRDQRTQYRSQFEDFHEQLILTENGEDVIIVKDCWSVLRSHTIVLMHQFVNIDVYVKLTVQFPISGHPH